MWEDVSLPEHETGGWVDVASNPGIAARSSDDEDFDFTSPSDYGRAVEGIGIASGTTRPVKDEYKEGNTQPQLLDDGRINQIAGEIGTGIKDLVAGGIIGAGDTVADIINFFDSENAAADGIRKGTARFRQEEIANPDGAADAVGSELGGMAAAAPIGGATAKLLGGGVNLVKQQVINRAAAGTKDFGKIMNRHATNKTDLVYAGGKAHRTLDERPIAKITQNISDKEIGAATAAATSAMKPFQLSLITQAVGKVSPTAEKVLEKYYNKIGSVFSKKAAFHTRLQFETDMKALGYSPKQITKMWNTITPTSPAAKKTGAATAALLNSADDL